MPKFLRNVLFYALFGLLATALEAVFLPQLFTASVTVCVVYGATMAVSMWLSNELELKAWATTFFSSRSDNAAVRLVLRLAIYLGLPTALFCILGAVGVMPLPRGVLTAFALTWLPLWLGAMLNFFPARKR